MSLSSTVNYVTESDFTQSNSALTEFTGTTVALEDQTPTNETLFVPFVTKDLLRSTGGSNTGTFLGSGSVSGGQLDLTVGNSGWSCVMTSKTGSDTDILEFRMVIVPQFTGGPAAEAILFREQKGSSDTSGQILLRWKTNTQFNLGIRTSADVSAFTEDLGGVSATSGTAIEIVGTFNCNTGAYAVYVDGVDLGVTNTTVVSRGTIDYFEIGSATVAHNLLVNHIERFDTIIQTANFTSPLTVVETLYSVADPTVLVNSGILLDSLVTFTGVVTETGGDLCNFVMNVSGTDKYHDGSSWVASDCSIAQSNTIAEVNTNAATLTTTAITLKIKAVLNSSDGSTTPSATSVTFTYSFSIAEPTAPNECICFGWEKDAQGNGISGLTVTLNLERVIKHGVFVIANKSVTTTTDSDGYWEFDAIIETASITKTVDFNFKDATISYDKRAISIPDQESVNINTLWTPPTS